MFDTGGISMKPAKGMEDMKGDMAGAACVAGLMHALAARKAKVNAVGIVGLVENMPSGTAIRPGDIIGSMAGRTIEVLNTDAEGRLVLADALHYVQERFKPKAIVDLATLTGAIMVALGKEHAGLFSNNDKLAQWLREAGEATGERVWRMPMDPAYDKEIDSKIADMKNIGGAYGGAITAAQFLKRFVGDVPWAHLDIAGVAMAANKSDINESWGNGFGIRLLGPAGGGALRGVGNNLGPGARGWRTFPAAQHRLASFAQHPLLSGANMAKLAPETSRNSHQAATARSWSWCHA